MRGEHSPWLLSRSSIGAEESRWCKWGRRHGRFPLQVERQNIRKYFLLSISSNRTFQLLHLSSGWASPEKNWQGSWEDSEVVQRCVSLVSLSPRLVKFLALSNQQACGSTPWPDHLTGLFVALLLFLVSTNCVECVEHSYQWTLRLWYLETSICAADGCDAITRLWSVTWLDLGVN